MVSRYSYRHDPIVTIYYPVRHKQYMTSKINPCRPGFGASCSFCCGSHNYTLAPETIEEMFIRRDAGSGRFDFRHPEKSLHEKLVKDGIQCANVGISGAEPGIVCCLAYHENLAGSGFESFFKGTCKRFLCSAWHELSDRQVLFAAELMKDWYYYSLIINSAELLIDLCADYGNPDDVPDDILEDLKDELTSDLPDTDLL